MNLDKWDAHRDVRRVSAYGRFGPDQKREFLSHLAFGMSQRRIGANFTGADLQAVYESIHRQFSLPRGEAANVVAEIESHNGLVLKSGFDSLQFYHKSIQEYLCAEVISRLPILPETLTNFWSLPDECAIAASHSGESSMFLAMFATRCFEELTGTADDGNGH